MSRAVQITGLAQLRQNFSEARGALTRRVSTALAEDVNLSLRGGQDYSLKAVNRTAGTLRQALRVIPKQDLRGLRSVSLEPRASENEAFYDLRRDRLSVSALRPASTRDRAQSILHEVGHRASLRNRKQRYITFRTMPKDELRILERGLSRWRGQLSGDNEPYGAYKTRERMGEMFADAYALHLMEPNRLRRISPRVARLFEMEDDA